MSIYTEKLDLKETKGEKNDQEGIKVEDKNLSMTQMNKGTDKEQWLIGFRASIQGKDKQKTQGSACNSTLAP